LDIYLPIADVSVNVAVLVALGAAVGFVSGLFGIGGGFLMTPVLVFLGIPPVVAVASEANPVAASSMSSVVSYGRKRAVDFRMGGLLVAQAGAERALYLFAHDRPWSYGLASVAIALSAGWAASAVFRRN
jgi:hypothetical protein